MPGAVAESLERNPPKPWKFFHGFGRYLSNNRQKRGKTHLRSDLYYIYEVKREYEPELKPFAVDPADYDEIVIGTPTWWYDMAPAVLTFMNNTDFSGKKVAVFQINAGWPGRCLKHMKKAARGADVIAERLFDFSPNDSSRYEMTSSKQKVEDFIAKL